MKPKPKLWITLLPIAICVILNAVGMLLARIQWAAIVGSDDGTPRPNALAAAVPGEAVAFIAIQLVSAGLLVLAGWASGQARELAVMTSGVAVMLAVFQWGGLLGERSSGSTLGIALAMAFALVVGVCAAVSVWTAIRLPRVEPPVAELGRAAVTVKPWTDHTRIATLLRLGPGLALIPITIAVLWAIASVGHHVAAGLTLLLTTFMVLQVLSWVRVNVDRHGVTARGLGVFTVIRVPLGEIDWAHPVGDINPLRDFGGWGVRRGFEGSQGLVTDAGSGVQINQRSGAPVIITVEHPSDAAAAINAWVWGRESASEADIR